MEKCYVYLHIKATDGEPFYVGKGHRKDRCGSKFSRSKFWHNIVKKYGFDIIILEENLTPEKAIELEKYWIERIGRRDLGKGPLVNLTDGGDGVIFKGEKNPFYGKKHKIESRILISKNQQKLILDIENGVYYESVDEIAKLGQYSKSQLYKWLQGIRKNKSNYKYC